jgi:TonB family protein
MNAQPEIRLLLELDTEVARWRRRTTFLLSVFLHGFLIVLLLVSPELFRRGAQFMGVAVERGPQRETTYLWFSPEMLKRLQEPPPDTNILSDKNRRAQGPSPTIDPDGVRLPYSPGNTPLPEIAGGGVPPLPPMGVAPTPPPGGARGSAPPFPEPKKEGPRLMDVPAESAGSGGSGLRLPTTTPGDAIQQSLAEAMRGRYGGGVPGPGDSTSQFENLHPNFSTEAPIILSDTLGVDFGPYLARVVYNVRRNWYAVIPESARLGEKGRVAIVFEILKDGSVPQLRLIASSGFDPLDRAALAAIHASNPFPPLPEDFSGNHLVLQFIFLYNLGYIP